MTTTTAKANKGRHPGLRGLFRPAHVIAALAALVFSTNSAMAADPVFSVHKNGVAQAVIADTATKLTWSTEVIDTNANFATDRFTPTVAGNYLIVVAAQCTFAGACVPSIYKNGTLYAGSRITNHGFADQSPQATAIIAMNGSTDYIEAFATTSGTSIGGTATQTYFNGTLVAGSGGGGGTTFTDSGSDSYTADDIAIGQSAIPDASAALEVESTSKGFLPPRMTTTERNAIASPATGLIIYNSVTGSPEFYDGTNWVKLLAGTTSSGGGSSNPSFLYAGNNDYNALGPTNASVGGSGNAITEVNLSRIFSSFSTGVLRAYGVNHTCGIEEGTSAAYCWGYNGNGQLGDGTTTQRSSPTIVSGGFLWSKISAKGAYYSCGVRSNNSGYCWGYNGTGAIGDGTTTDRLTPRLVNGGYAWSHISAGGRYAEYGTTCGVTTSNVGYCWGYNGYGEIGDNTTTQRLSPTLVSGAHAWSFIESGGIHSCGVTTGGDMYCWGYNGNGAIGDGTTTQRNIPRLVNGGYSWSAVGVGQLHSCGLNTAGKMYCWGYNAYGQLGNGNYVNQTAPVAVFGAKTWRKVMVGDTATCGITTQNALYCWGYNASGQLGDGSGTNQNKPLLILDNVTDADQSGYHLMVRVD